MFFLLNHTINQKKRPDTGNMKKKKQSVVPQIKVQKATRDLSRYTAFLIYPPKKKNGKPAILRGFLQLHQLS